MDFSVPQSGNFSPTFRFSDLFVWSLRRGFTGGMLVHPFEGQVVVMFREGAPTSVTGRGARTDFLGELLKGFGDVDTVALEKALEVQKAMASAGAQRPILGALLKVQKAVGDLPLTAALQLQVKRRLSRLFAIQSGPWQTAPSTAAQTWSLGHAIDGRSLVMPGLESHAAPEEIEDVSNVLRGWAVRRKGELSEARALGGEANHDRLIGLLEAPRSIETLDALIENRRTVRVTLRALMLFELLDAVPASEAVPVLAPSPGYDALATGEYPALTPVHGVPVAAMPAVGMPAVGMPAAFASVLDPTTAPPTPIPVAPVMSPSVAQRLPAEALGGFSTPSPAFGSPIPDVLEAPTLGSGEHRVPSSGRSPTPVPSAARGRKRGPKLSLRKDVPVHMRAAVEELERLDGIRETASAFELLGLPSSASGEEAANRHKELLRKLNPDVMARYLPEDLLELAGEVLSALDEATDVLTDAHKRVAHLEAAQKKKGESAVVDEDKKQEAELRFKMAKVHLQKREFAKARQHFKFALDVEPMNGTFRASLGWAFWSDPSLDAEGKDRGYALVTEGALLARTDPMVQCWHGSVLRDRGEIERARSVLKTVLELEPGHSGALRELRALEAEHGVPTDPNAKQDPKGLAKLGKLFKR